MTPSSVSFSTDLSAFDAGLARRGRSLRPSAPRSTISLAATDAARVANDALKNALAGAGVEATTLKSAVAGADAALAGAAQSATKAATAFGSAGLTATYLTRETRALLDEASSNRWRQFDGTVVNLAFHMAQAGAGFLAANPLIAAAGAAAAAAGGWMAYLAVEATRTTAVFNQLKASLNFTGADQTDAQIVGLTNAIRNLSGVTQAEALKISASLGSIQSAAARSAIVAEIPALTEARDIKPDEAAKQLEEIFKNPFESAKRLSDIFGQLTDAEQTLLQQADATGDANKALAASIDVVGGRYEIAHAQRLRDIDDQVKQQRAAISAAEAMGDAGLAAVEQAQKAIGALEAERARIATTNDELRKQSGILKTTQTSVEQVRDAFDDALRSVAPWTTELEKASEAANALKAGLGALGAGGTSSAAAAAILGQESGNRDHPGTSVTGAIGPGQVEPDTFKQFARPGEDINNPTDNRAVAERIVEAYWKQFNGDITRVAVAYFSG